MEEFLVNARSATTNSTTRPTVLVHLHCFYVNQINDYLHRLAKLRDLADFYLVATIAESISNPGEVTQQIRRTFPDAQIIKVQNLGYDIGPFVEALRSVDLDRYDYVLKLHTKGRGKEFVATLKGLQVNDDVWVQMLTDALIGSREKFAKALGALAANDVGMVAAKPCIITDNVIRRQYYVNRVNDELKELGLPSVSSVSFVSGTMYMARASLLKRLTHYKLGDFGKPFSGLYDYTLAHVLERLSGAIIKSQGYRLVGLKTSTHRIKRRIDRILYNLDFENDVAKPLGEVIEKWRGSFRFNHQAERTIRTSPYFDADWYKTQYPEIGDADAARHYLEKGYKEGKNPSREFDGDYYINAHPDCKELGCNPLLHYECFMRSNDDTSISADISELVKLATIRQSPFFDAEWYKANNPDIKQKGIDPVEHYLKHGGFTRRDPSPYFCSDEYLSINPDVRLARINPLYHYLTEGFLQGHAVSSVQLVEPKFDESARACRRTFSKRPTEKRRTAVVATYTVDGHIHEDLLYLLRGLLEVVDNIVLVGDCPLIPQELEKLEGIVSYALYERSGEYDFGSYKRGLRIAREIGLLDVESVDELVMLNDSCYGPVYPLSESFDYMATKQWDYWGYNSSWSRDVWFLCSFFYVFNRKIIDSKLLDEFFKRVNGPVTRGQAVEQFETKLSVVLNSQGLVGRALVESEDGPAYNHRNTKIGLMRYRVPLIKKKSIAGESNDNIMSTLRIIERDNPELYALIDKRQYVPKQNLPMSPEEYRASIPQTVERIRNKMLKGERVLVAFFVNDAAMFPGRSLFDLMCTDECFEPYIAVIPDYRYPGSITKLRRDCRRELEKSIPKEYFVEVEPNRYGAWNDIASTADIVCYSTPYSVSRYLYNARYAIGRHFLPIIFNYGYYRSIYDRDIMGMFSYSCCWKVFMECDATMDEYARYSELHGANASLVGYAKMDRLSEVVPTPHERPRVLVALHHSIDGGYNQTLALANFVRYFDFFRKLPDSYPGIDFIYRPHPALFKALERAEGWDGRKVNAFISSMRAKPNVIWSDGGDYFQEFADSDACIQDCGSFLVEYFYTGKPCCYMLKTPEDIDAKFAPLGKECLEQCYISYSTDDIDEFIKKVVLEADDPKAEGRSALAERIMLNYPHAAEVALQDIKDSIMSAGE